MNLLGIILQAETEGGSTIGSIIANLPRDPAAIVVYIMLAVCAYFIWLGTRSSGSEKEEANREAAD